MSWTRIAPRRTRPSTEAPDSTASDELKARAADPDATHDHLSQSKIACLPATILQRDEVETSGSGGGGKKADLEEGDEEHQALEPYQRMTRE